MVNLWRKGPKTSFTDSIEFDNDQSQLLIG